MVKEIFNVFINRTIAYHYSHHIGLVTFNSYPTVNQGIMAVIENLRTQVLEINASGGTNIWDALLKPEQCLRTYSVKYPNAKKRIVALSDGEDNAHQRCAGPSDLRSDRLEPPDIWTAQDHPRSVHRASVGRATWVASCRSVGPHSDLKLGRSSLMQTASRSNQI